MNSEFEMMIDDIVLVTGYQVEFDSPNGQTKRCRIWETKLVLFSDYTSGSFTGALKKAWQDLCG